MAVSQTYRVDVVLVWAFDRFARSTKQLVEALEEFDALGVDFISHQQQIDTTTPAGKQLFTITATFAEFERGMISERVRAGQAAAKAKASTSAGRLRIGARRPTRYASCAKTG